MRETWFLPILLLCAFLAGPEDSFGGLPLSKGVGRGNPPRLMVFDQEAHVANDVYLMVTDRGQVGLDYEWGRAGGFFPNGTGNNYVFGTGLWIGGLADVNGDGVEDTVLTQGYNPQWSDSELLEGRVGQDPSDPLARIFNSLDPLDFLEWPPEFRHFDPEIGDSVPLIYSTQDLVTIYNGVNGTPVFGVGNLPVEVHQRTMAFQGEDIGQVIYAVFDMTNVSEQTPEGPYPFEGVWIGYDSDMDVGADFSDDMTSVLLQGVTGSDTVDLDMGIAWDSDFTEYGFTQIPGFVGVMLIQSPGNPRDGIDNDGDGVTDESPANGIDDDGDGKTDEPDEVDELGLVNYSKICNPTYPCDLNDPESDRMGYDILACDTKGSTVSCLEDPTPADIRFMLSSGPFDWLPGETVRLVIAFVFSEPVGEPSYLQMVGDPPRPDPGDPVLSRLVEVAGAARSFWLTAFGGYEPLLDIVGTTVLADTNDPLGPYEVNTNVVDSVGISRVSLFYRSGDEPFIEVPMDVSPPSEYSATIPGFPFGTSIQYYIQAVDSLFFVDRDPEDAPLTTYDFEIVDSPTFGDITSHLPDLAFTPQAAVWFDYDLDGDEDLLACGPNDNALYRNDGSGYFEDATSEAGISPAGLALGTQVADYDNDGDLDLYVISYTDRNLLYENQGDGTFTDVAGEAGVDIQVGTQGAIWGDYDRDGDHDLFLFGHSEFTPILFRNRGDGTFEDVTEAAGLNGISATLTEAAAFFDHDADGDLDLYLVTNGENVLFDNDGDGTFTDRTLESGLTDGGVGKDLTLGDYDNDGDIDLFLLNDGHNRLFQSNGDGTFLDVASEAAIQGYDSDFATFADINMDGYLDILLSAPNILIQGGDGTFTDHTDFSGVLRGGEFIIPADLEGDGDIDLYDSRLYENRGYPVDLGRKWLHIRLNGLFSPRDGIGSTVEVVAGDQRLAMVYGAGTGRSMGSLPVEFGLGDASVVDSLIVHWTSGIVQEVEDVSVNQVVEIVEDTTLAGIGGDGDSVESPALPRTFDLGQNYPNPFNPSTTIRFAIPDVGGSESYGSDRNGGWMVGSSRRHASERLVDESRDGEERAIAGSRGIKVSLRIYDLRGRYVKTLVDEKKEPGYYQVCWDGRDSRGVVVSSGIYIYRLNAGTYRSTRKMVVLR